MNPDGRRVRPVGRDSASEIRQVAERMRDTLVEVLGREQGEALYTIDWLVERVRFHLDPASCTGEVFVCEERGGHVSGHAIVRAERDDAGREFGLFSTIFVEPPSRRAGVGGALIARGEQWMRALGLSAAETYTSESNAKLIALFGKHGYALAGARPDKRMVILAKRLCAN